MLSSKTMRALCLLLPPVCVLTVVLGTTPAQAQVRRALVEPPDAKKEVAKVKVDLLKADPGLASCAPKRHQTQDGVDWMCKVGALRVAANAEVLDVETPLDKNKPLQRRARLVSLALDTADALAFFQPQGSSLEDLPKWKVASQGEACRAAQDLFAAIAQVPENKPVAGLLLDGFSEKDAPRLAGRGLKEVTCTCHERTLSLGRSGMLSDRDEAMARAQRAFYAVGCNLKTTGRESSLVTIKKDKTEVDLTPVGGKTRPADLDREDATRVAERRKVELNMCVESNARGPTAVEKMVRCACPLMERWRFPKREVEGTLSIQVVVAEKLAPVTLDINNKGVVEKCAP